MGMAEELGAVLMYLPADSVREKTWRLYFWDWPCAQQLADEEVSWWKLSNLTTENRKSPRSDSASGDFFDSREDGSCKQNPTRID